MTDTPHETPDPSPPVPGFRHEPVMCDRVLELLLPALDHGIGNNVALDATLGLGGHSEALLRATTEATLLGVDQDAEALALARDRLKGFGSRFVALQGNFAGAVPLAAAEGWRGISAFLFDLGVSSMQLDSDARGFAYARETGLDMRMDRDGPLTARDVVNDYSPEELNRVIRVYGEERHATRIVRAIDRTRRITPITTSRQLADLVESAVPAQGRRRGHPAKRVFQALRIEVNDELGVLRTGLEDAIRAVAVGGRIAVLSYHSLEDRIVKRLFASGVRPAVDPDLPFIPEFAQPFLAPLTRGAEVPGPDEVERNRRAAPAKLRAVSKTRPVPAEWRAVA